MMIVMMMMGTVPQAVLGMSGQQQEEYTHAPGHGCRPCLRCTQNRGPRGPRSPHTWRR